MFASKNKMRTDYKHESENFDRRASKDEFCAHRRSAQKDDGGDNQEPARYEHQQPRKFHG